MSRPKMLPGTRSSKEMLSTRIPSWVYDRMRAYALSSRFTIEEITTAAIDAYLDAQAPETKTKFPPPAELTAPGTSSNDADARIDALEAKLDRVLSALTQAPAAEPAPGGKRRRA